MNTKSTLKLVRTAVIAAIYASLTLLLAPLSYGPIQLRVSEALTILPLFYIEAVPGLAIGCFLANIANGPIDMFVGGGATLIAAMLTFFLRKPYFGFIPPIVVNAFVVPLIFLAIGDNSAPYIINVVTVGIGQLIAVLVFGIPTYFCVRNLSRKFPSLYPSVKPQRKKTTL